MRPGILVQHARVADRPTQAVRGDVTAILGFVPKRRWPAGRIAGDFIEVLLEKKADLWSHPDRERIDVPARLAAGAFFDNGGELAHLFGVCIPTSDDIVAPSLADHLGPLFDRLRAEDDIAILIAPALAYLGFGIERNGELRARADAIYDVLLEHCREMNNRFLLLDPPRGLHGVPLLRWVRSLRERAPASRSYGALYYPWLCAGDDVFPPSGTVAGSFARIEHEFRPFGVVWPPANRPLQAVSHPELDLDWSEAGTLAEAHVNPIVVQPGRGVVVHGARTLSQDPLFLHINSRRILNLVGEQVRRDSEWAVFETNNPHLWDVLGRNVRHRLDQFWSAGLLKANDEGERYDVVCDDSCNLPADREAGRLKIELWVQPVGTTERIRIDLQLGGRPTGGA